MTIDIPNQYSSYPCTGDLSRTFGAVLPAGIEVHQQTWEQFEAERFGSVINHLRERAVEFVSQAKIDYMPAVRVVDVRAGDQRSVPVFILIKDVDVLGGKIPGTLHIGRWDEEKLAYNQNVSRQYALAASADPSHEGELFYLEQVISSTGSNREDTPFFISERSPRGDSIYDPGTSLSGVELCSRVDQRLQREYETLIGARNREASSNGNRLLRPHQYYTSYLVS